MPTISETITYILTQIACSSPHSNPLLLLANMGNTSYPNNPEWNVYDFGKNTSIQMILRNYFPIVHPMHLHGHQFFVLAEGVGDWDGQITNPENPQRRDTQLMVAGSPDLPSYLVIQWNTDNPGVWPLHCHSFVHSSAGLLINVLVSQRCWLHPSILMHTSRNGRILLRNMRSRQSWHRPAETGLGIVA